MLLGFLAASPCAAESDCVKARTLAAQAVGAFKDYPRKSLADLESAHQMCPEDKAITYNLGVALYLSRKPGEAYAQWSRLAADYADSRLLVNLGWLAFELGMVEKAEEWRKKSEALNPSDPNAVALHVEILFAMDKPKEALDIAALNKGRVPFKISKSHLEKVTESIWEVYKSGDKDEASAQMKDAIREYPEIKKLQRARDIMRAVFFDKKVDASD